MSPKEKFNKRYNEIIENAEGREWVAIYKDICDAFFDAASEMPQLNQPVKPVIFRMQTCGCEVGQCRNLTGCPNLNLC